MQFRWPRLDLERCRNAGELCAAAAIPLGAAVAIFFLVSAGFKVGPKLGAPEASAQAAVWGR